MAERAEVCALDVSFFTFRAYHALPPLNTSSGLPTNAVHGVAAMLERLFRTEKPRYAAAAFDLPGPTFRSEIYPEYKANRDAPDEELRVQFPYVRRLVEAMAIRCFSDTRYEADDILATLARHLAAAGHSVVIVTGDKDLMQCVTELVTLYDPVRDLRVGIPQVIEKFGVPPSAVADVQGLMGDSTDNIPGVKGVGPKTAARLIQHFGSLENLLANTRDIETLDIRGAASVRKKVEENVEAAMLSKRLATIDSNVELPIEMAELEVGPLHTPELLALAEELEMERFAARVRGVLPAQVEEDRAATAPPEPTRLESPRAPSLRPAGDWRQMAGNEVALVLTTDAAGAGILALECAGRHALVEGNEAVRATLAALAEASTSFSGFDLKGMARDLGIRPGPNGLDLGVASYLYDPSVGEHEPADVAMRFLREAIAEARGAAENAEVALAQVVRLIAALRSALAEHEQTLLYSSLEHPLIECLAAIEARGIALDKTLLENISVELAGRMEALVVKIFDAAGGEFNILSPLQLRDVLFSKLGLPTRGIKTTKSGPSTDRESLEDLAEHHALPGLVLEYRELAKLKSTYADTLPRLVDAGGRIHTRLNQTVTATGRLSSKDPNLQNIPVRTEDGRRIRAAFVAPPGMKLLSADYNQIELRVLADLSRDRALVAAFDLGQDIHQATAAEVFEVDVARVTPGMRRTAKVINYGIIYGMGPLRMSRELGISRSKAGDFIRLYFERYSGVKTFYEQMLERARRLGYTETRAGRRRYLPDIHSTNGGLRQAAERVATNTPIQGGAADIIKAAMVHLAEAMRSEGLESSVVLQIHDELLLECPEREVDRLADLTRDCMKGAASLAVPVVVDIGVGRNWAAAH
jgi:DNA polymerase-1